MHANSYTGPPIYCSNKILMENKTCYMPYSDVEEHSLIEYVLLLKKQIIQMLFKAKSRRTQQDQNVQEFIHNQMKAKTAMTETKAT